MGKLNAERDLEDLRGKVVIVTGANGGIGWHTAQFLIRQGAKVYLGARNEKKAQDAIAKLNKEGLGSNGGSVEWLECDISNPIVAQAAAKRFLEKESRLDILVNNAGSLGDAWKLKEGGIQEVVLVNHFGPFALTEALLPLLKQTAQLPGADVRIVDLTSMGHAFVSVKSLKGKEALNNKFGGSGVKAQTDRYGFSKLLNILHIKELQRRLTAEKVDITCIAVHPGAVASPGFLEFAGNMKVVGSFMPSVIKVFVKTETDGAMNPSFAAAAKAVKADKEKYKGAYLVPYGKIEKGSKNAQDPQLAKDLWETSEQVLAEINGTM